MLSKYKNKKNFIFIIFPSLLIVLLPIFLITGPFLPDLSISLCSLLFLINSITNFDKMKKYYFNSFFYIFLIFWIILIISSALSSYPLYSLQTSLAYIRFVFFSLSLWFILDLNPKIINFIFYSLLLSFGILVFDGFFQFFYKKNILGQVLINNRVSSFFGDELVLGSYLSRLYPMLWGIFLYLNLYKNQKIIFFFIFFYLLIDVLIFLSGERVAFFYLNLFSFLIIFLSNTCKIYRIQITVLSIIVILIISNLFPDTGERVFHNTYNQFISKQQTGEQKKINIFSIEHENHYKSAIKMFADNKIFGIGPKLFRKHCEEPRYVISKESCSTHPHNTYIQLLSESGIIGFAIILFIFLKIIQILFYQLFKKKNKLSDFQISLLISILISLWPLAPSGNFFGNWLNIIYFFPVGILLWSSQNKLNKN